VAKVLIFDLLGMTNALICIIHFFNYIYLSKAGTTSFQQTDLLTVRETGKDDHGHLSFALFRKKWI